MTPKAVTPRTLTAQSRFCSSGRKMHTRFCVVLMVTKPPVGPRPPSAVLFRPATSQRRRGGLPPWPDTSCRETPRWKNKNADAGITASHCKGCFAASVWDGSISTAIRVQGGEFRMCEVNVETCWDVICQIQLIVRLHILIQYNEYLNTLYRFLDVHITVLPLKINA